MLGHVLEGDHRRAAAAGSVTGYGAVAGGAVVAVSPVVAAVVFLTDVSGVTAVARATSVSIESAVTRPVLAHVVPLFQTSRGRSLRPLTPWCVHTTIRPTGPGSAVPQ